VPEIRPFPGILYRVAADELASVLAPPYDVIPPGHRDELYARDPRNVVRVILNRNEGEAGYREAGETYRRWREEGLLAPDTEPALYLLEQTFSVEGGERCRRGLLARFRAEDPDKRVVLPHEQTRKGPKEDRYRVLRATKANFSPIFMMFPDPARRFDVIASEATAAPPALAYTDDGGVAHRLWRIVDGGTVASLEELLGRTKAYIADGHHRYATALRYRDEVGPEGAWTFGYFTPLGGPGLVVLPYHRILTQGPTLPEARAALESRFSVTESANARAAAVAVALTPRPYAFGLAEPGGGAFVAEARPEAAELLDTDAPSSLRALDTYFLHHVVLDRILSVPAEAVQYPHSLVDVEEALGASRCRLAVLMRPTPVGQIVDVAEAGESMPAKSTFFHPKLPSGLVIHPLVA
jgi:uncharacterized protein (DUF1015 family)